MHSATGFVNDEAGRCLFAYARAPLKRVGVRRACGGGSGQEALVQRRHLAQGR